MDNPGWTLAIDFGTSFTTGAMGVDGGPPAVVEVEHSRYLPSVVVADGEGQLLTGQAAQRQGVVFPDRAARVPKRDLVAGPQVVLGGRPVPVTALVAAVLSRVHGEAVRFQGGQPPDTVVLTHPARWGDVPLGRLREAAAAAGIADPVLISEPVAAAWWFGGPTVDGGLVAVFDLGGGTLDTAVLQTRSGGFAIAGPPGGDASLGGEDFDELLLGRISDLARDRDQLAWQDVFDSGSLRSRRDLALLRGDVTTAKEALSDLLAYEVVVPGFAEGFRITRPELDELFGHKVDVAVAEMRKTIAAAGTTPTALTGLYLTGGSSRMPIIAERLAASLGLLPRLRDDPKAAVALGALVALRQPLSRLAQPWYRNIAAAGGTAGTGPLKSRVPGGEHAAAEAEYREAIRHDPASAAAQTGLASALMHQGRNAEAEAAAREAVRLEPGLAAAHESLGAVLLAQNRYAEAEDAARKAISLDASAPPAAQIVLADALTNSEKYKDAHDLLQNIDSSDTEISLKTTAALGRLRLAQQSYPAAQTAFQKVIDSGHADLAPVAFLDLGNMLSQVNRFDEARAAYERAIKSSNPFAAQTALSKLGAMLNAQGDTSGARNAYAAAADSGNSDLAPYGAYLLGCSRGTPDATGREPQGEREAFQQAIDSGHPEFAPRTAFEFGKILNDRANYAEARTRLDYAIKSGHPTYSPQGAYQLADMLRKNQNFADAREAYEQVIDVGHGLAAQAATDLGDMLHSNGDYVAADVAYRRAITLKEPRDAYELGIKLASQGYTETAQAAFESAADRAGDIYSPAARLAIEHLSELQSDLNGSNGKIIIKCLTTFGVSNASVTVYINGSPHVARFNAASIVQEVSPGVQLIGRSAADDLKTSGGSIVFYLPPGKSGYLECRWRYTGPEFTLGRIR